MNPTPIDVRAVHWGHAALDELATVLADEKRGDPLSRVTIIVPNNFVGVATRRALAASTGGSAVRATVGLAAVDFVTVYRLAERLAGKTLAGAGRRPLSTPVIASALRRVLRQQPGLFAGVADHPTTERRLVQAYRELSDVDDAGCTAVAGASPRSHEVVRLYREAKALLADRWFDEQDLLEAAALVEGDPFDRLGRVVLFLPDALSPPRTQLLSAIHAHAGITVIAAFTGVTDADAAVRASLGRLGIEAAPSVPTAPLPHTTATNVSDPDDEVRHVVRELLAAAGAGVRFDQMAVIYASDQPYARLLHDHLRAASIPFNGAAVGSLRASVVGRTLVALLDLDRRDLARDDVMGLVASLPFRWQGRPAPTRAWEQVSRAAGVVRGLDDWQQRLDRFAADCLADAAALATNPENEWRARRLVADADRARDLREFVEHLRAELDRATRAGGWAARVRWCRRMLRLHLGDLREWPADEVEAAERLDLVLERISGLDSVDEAPTTAVFQRVLETELEAGLGRVGRLGDGVLIGRAWVAAGLTLERLWVLGLSEGTFPSRPVDDSLLPDHERARAGGQLPLRRARVGDEHRHLLAAVAAVAPSGTAHLFRSRGDLRANTERAPSRWLADLRGSSEAWDHEVASFAQGVASAVFPATGQEHTLQALLHSAPADHLAVAGGDATFAASIDAVVARRSDTFTRFDGKVPPNLVPRVDDAPTSATALETWAGCPHAYFARYLLGVLPRDSPERRLRIDALARGTLVHAILDRFVGDRTSIREMRLWGPADERDLMRIADMAFDEVHARGLTGEALYWRRDQVLIRRDLRRFLAADNARRSEDDLVPICSELVFGTATSAAVDVTVSGGRRLALRGSIDRIDEGGDGTLHVLDYKTGKAFKVGPDDPHGNGTRLQLVLYAQAAQVALDRPNAPVHSSYWFVSRAGGFRQSGYVVTETIRAAVNTAVRTIIDNIEAGRFPQHPDAAERGGAYIACHYCDPDGLGTRAERRRFETIAATAELAAYVALAEPGLVPPPVVTQGGP